MISQFFIDRPRFAFVLVILMSLCGGIALFDLPVAEYPELAPATIRVSASYPGASAQVVADSIAIPVEDQINGVENLLYYSSSCDNNGSYSCSVTFKSGADTDMALVNLQNAVKRAERKLPSTVKQQGISVQKRNSDMLALWAFTTDGTKQSLQQLGDYVEKNIKEAVMRLDGVSVAEVMASREYAMRIWLDPVRMASLNLSITDVSSAIEKQNVQAAAGTVGSEYASRYLSYKLNAEGRLKSADEFADIVVRSDPATGGQVLLGDVARIELGSKSYSGKSLMNGKEAIVLSVYKTPEANALAVVKRVKAELAEWDKRLPAGVAMETVHDATAFTLVFMKAIVSTLFMALGLVVLITWLFLQDWRATIVPAAAIPVSLLATFIFVWAFGYTINILTMFGLILVIGSLVDDAIVVVENTQTLMATEGLSAKEAAKKSMRQITSAVIATTLVTIACYIPLVFYGGMVGKMYIQFAFTMCVALSLSTCVALTLSPVLCSLLLRKPGKPSRLFAPVNIAIDGSRKVYLAVAGLLVRRGIVTALLFAAATGTPSTANSPRAQHSSAPTRCWRTSRRASRTSPESPASCSCLALAPCQAPARTVDRAWWRWTTGTCAARPTSPSRRSSPRSCAARRTSTPRASAASHHPPSWVSAAWAAWASTSAPTQVPRAPNLPQPPRSSLVRSPPFQRRPW